MRIHIVPRRMTLSREERSRVASRLRLALTRYGGMIRGVVLFMGPTDQAGRRYFSCRLVARTRNGVSWTVADVHQDLMVAVDGAARRLARWPLGRLGVGGRRSSCHRARLHNPSQDARVVRVAVRRPRVAIRPGNPIVPNWAEEPSDL